MVDRFEPRIIAFACNWCSYAGADLAGVSRLQYAPNVKIIRVMCSGRVELEFILNAFLRGADGVMILGCHPGDCHYLSGNEKAQKLVDEVARPVIGRLGIGRERLALEWISASEGPRFAAVINGFVDQIRTLGPSPLRGEKDSPGVIEEESFDCHSLLKHTRALSCYQCGLCTSSCPISRNRPDYNPRKTVRRTTFGQVDRVAGDPEIWNCLTCGLCSSYCPHQVDYPGFVREMRSQGVAMGKQGDCAHGGAIQKIHEIQIGGPRQKRLDWIPDNRQCATGSGDTFFFVGCAPYFEPLFKDDGSKLLDIARDGLTVLNRLGIVPVISPDEACCGHDFLWSGLKQKYEALARQNLEMIRKTGAKRVVFTCAECYYTFTHEYQNLFGSLPFKTVHLTQLVSERLRERELDLGEVINRVTFHDPCRLGRLSSVFEEPREVITGIKGTQLIEMSHNRMHAVCCGSSGWTNCFQANKKIQVERLREAADTGAKTLVTACPKCQIHLNCAKSSPDVEISLEIKDITTLIAEASR